jgi:predicted alpha/beta superfamily hydrolase
MTTLHRLLIVAGATLFFAAPSLTSSVSEDGGRTGEKNSPRQVELPGTQLLTIHSSIVGRDYDLYVSLPRNYHDTTRRFPVVYLLDGQYDFPLVNGIYGDLYYDGFLPELITVGITWGGEHPNYDSLRTRDFTPTSIKEVPSTGNGPKFLASIKGELIPYIDSQYRTDKKDRTLMGSSLGGLFTLYTMFHETDLFTRYVLTSPAIMWDNNVLSSYEESYHTQHARLPARLFMAVSALEGSETTFGKFVDRLKSRKYQDLQIETMVLEGMGHAGSKPEGYTRGLQSVFARLSKNINPSKLNAFVGKYRLNPQVTVRILAENDHLVLIAPDSTKIELLVESDNDFFVRGMFLFIKFHTNGSGAITGAHVEQFQGGFDLTKEP